MVKNLFILQIVIFLSTSMLCFSQTSQHRGLYVDKFVSQILGNQQKTQELLDYIEYNNLNSITLYGLSGINYENQSQLNLLAEFIVNARQKGITSVGVSTEISEFLENEIISYNHSRQPEERFNTFNFEFEFWVPEHVQAGGIYCNNYLAPRGYSCNEAGAFNFYIDELTQIKNLAETEGITTEVYLGWFSQAQVSQILNHTDRILLHAYVQDQEIAFSYSRDRLNFIENTKQQAEIIGLFSSEPEFLKNWLENHNNDTELAYQIYHEDLIQDRNWAFVNEVGFQWFNYSYMPKTPVMGNSDFAANDSQLIIVPNPAENQVQIIGETNWIKNLKIYNLNGQLISDRTFNKQFSVSSLPTGVYLLKFSGDRKSKTLKLIKK